MSLGSCRICFTRSGARALGKAFGSRFVFRSVVDFPSDQALHGSHIAVACAMQEAVPSHGPLFLFREIQRFKLLSPQAFLAAETNALALCFSPVILTFSPLD